MCKSPAPQGQQRNVQKLTKAETRKAFPALRFLRNDGDRDGQWFASSARNIAGGVASRCNQVHTDFWRPGFIDRALVTQESIRSNVFVTGNTGTGKLDALCTRICQRLNTDARYAQITEADSLIRLERPYCNAVTCVYQN